MPSVRNAIQNTIARAPLHGRWWVNDPDCIIMDGPAAGTRASSEGRSPAGVLNSRLSRSERESLWTAVALSGGSLIDSDNLRDLGEDAWEQLGRMIPPLPGKPFTPNWFNSSALSQMAMRLESGLGEWLLLAVFNWMDRPQSLSVDIGRLCNRCIGGWHAFEAWSGDYAAIEQEARLITGEIAPHGVRLYALRENSGKPMWLGDQLHISQGLVVESWRAAQDRVTARLAPAHPGRGKAWVWLPGDLASVALDGNTIEFHGDISHVYQIDLDVHGPAELTLRLG
jgi:alpha-galactosidase